MNPRFLLACVAVFVTWMAGSFVVHGKLLHNDDAQLPKIMRPEADAAPWLPQGLRYGLAVAFPTVVPSGGDLP
jgi:hypothetical protein